jgi:hypothetical protein
MNERDAERGRGGWSVGAAAGPDADVALRLALWLADVAAEALAATRAAEPDATGAGPAPEPPPPRKPVR